MPFPAAVLKVMIASPGDVAEERKAIREIIAGWNAIHAEDRGQVLLPVGWDTHSTPTMGDRPQSIINRQVLADCDLLVAVFWTRLGSPTGVAKSGTVEEIEEHLAAGKPAMLYFSNAPVHPDSVNEDQYRSLREFKAECIKRGLVESYDSLTEFRDKLSRQLSQMMIRDFPTLELPTTEESDEGGESQAHVQDLLSDEAKELLIAAAGSDGYILLVRTLSTTNLQAANRTFIANATPKEIARWKAALKELVAHELIEDRGHEGEFFEVTLLGHEVAEEILADGRVGERGSDEE